MSRHILSVDHFTRSELVALRSLGLRLAPIAQKKMGCDVLRGALMANLFFEASTRTRMSFHTAFARLGGMVCDTTGFTFSSISKGESLEDTARVIESYADVIVMRHPEQGSVAQFARLITTPVINAGDGSGEHPSQALLDYYTIEEEFARLGKTIDGMTITMVGDLKHGRTIHSLSKLLAVFRQLNFVFVSPENLSAPPELVAFLRAQGHSVRLLDDVREGVKDADVLYATRIQKERFAGEAPTGYSEQYRINRALIEGFAPPEMIIMHPLPRDSRPGAFDLDSDLDDLPQLAIFRQAANGVIMRMALFVHVLGVASNLESHFFNLEHSS